MPDLPVIDAHVHLYRDVATEKRALPIPGRRDRDRWGNADEIVPYMDREGVSHVVALNFYPTGVMRRVLRSRIPPGLAPAEADAARERVERELADGVRRQNDWLCDLGRREPRVVAGIGVQKLLGPDGLVREVERCAAMGARAVKMVPGWFHEYPDDRAFWPMYARCEELGLPVVADTGTVGLGRHQAHPDVDNPIAYGEPARFRDVLASFPHLTVVMCHFPSAFWEQRTLLAREFPNLFFDVSGGFDAPGIDVRDRGRAIPEGDAARRMREVGIERMMFGSDGPHVMLQPYLEQLLRLDLDDDERRLVLVDNSRRIYRF